MPSRGIFKADEDDDDMNLKNRKTDRYVASV